MESKDLVVKNFSEIDRKERKSKCQIYTTITDKKTIFNLEASVDFRINDLKGEEITVKDIMIKEYTKKLDQPLIDIETGDILKDEVIKIVTILIDNDGQSYVTGSNAFGFQMLKYIEMFGTEEIETDGLKIRIIEKEVKNSNNRALGFELI